LANPSLFGFWRLPKSEDQKEAGYYSYNPSGRAYDPRRQYAAPETLSVINDLELKWGMQDNRRIGIGDINMPLGDDFPKTDDSPGPVHHDHHDRLAFDFRVLRKDARKLLSTIRPITMIKMQPKDNKVAKRHVKS